MAQPSLLEKSSNLPPAKDAESLCRYLEKIDWPDSKLRLFACWCVRHTPLGDGRTVWDLLTDPYSPRVVEISERFAKGQASLKEMEAAVTLARTNLWGTSPLAEDWSNLPKPQHLAKEAAYATGGKVARVATLVAQDTSVQAVWAFSPTNRQAALDFQARRLLEDESFRDAVTAYPITKDYSGA